MYKLPYVYLNLRMFMIHIAPVLLQGKKLAFNIAWMQNHNKKPFHAFYCLDVRFDRDMIQNVSSNRDSDESLPQQ